MRDGHVGDVAEKTENMLSTFSEKEGRERKAIATQSFVRGSHCDAMMNAPHDSPADLMTIGKWFERIAYGSGADAFVAGLSRA